MTMRRAARTSAALSGARAPSGPSSVSSNPIRVSSPELDRAAEHRPGGAVLPVQQHGQVEATDDLQHAFTGRDGQARPVVHRLEQDPNYLAGEAARPERVRGGGMP